MKCPFLGTVYRKKESEWIQRKYKLLLYGSHQEILQKCVVSSDWQVTTEDSLRGFR